VLGEPEESGHAELGAAGLTGCGKVGGCSGFFALGLAAGAGGEVLGFLGIRFDLRGGTAAGSTVAAPFAARFDERGGVVSLVGGGDFHSETGCCAAVGNRRSPRAIRVSAGACRAEEGDARMTCNSDSRGCRRSSETYWKAVLYVNAYGEPSFSTVWSDAPAGLRS
jgi:hypothetical protein